MSSTTIQFNLVNWISQDTITKSKDKGATVDVIDVVDVVIHIVEAMIIINTIVEVMEEEMMMTGTQVLILIDHVLVVMEIITVIQVTIIVTITSDQVKVTLVTTRDILVMIGLNIRHLHLHLHLLHQLPLPVQNIETKRYTILMMTG